MENQGQNIVKSWVEKTFDPEDRVEMARSVTATMETRGWGVFVQVLDQLVADQQKLVIWAEKTPTYEEMVSRTARLRGLLWAQGIPAAVLEAGRSADDELRQIAEALERATA